ncbi:MAG TPA: DinB family protein [Terriglobales bacterium]|nr:DinB family protein [Terriglobales bacterium]
MTKRSAVLIVLAMALVGASLAADDKKSEPGPVTSTVKALLERNTKNIVAAAEAMPADKYSFKPTADQMTFAHLAVHTAEANYFFCSKIAGEAQPELKTKDTDAKEKLVEEMKASFAYCGTALEKMDDSKLGDSVAFGQQQRPRAAAVIGAATNWADHYGMAAMYLRLNGVLPPTAQPKK